MELIRQSQLLGPFKQSSEKHRALTERPNKLYCLGWDMQDWRMCIAITLSTIIFLSLSLSDVFFRWTTFKTYIILFDEFSSSFHRLSSKVFAVIQTLLVWVILYFLLRNSFLSHHLKDLCPCKGKLHCWWFHSIVLEA